jgi:hypothetical protein
MLCARLLAARRLKPYRSPGVLFSPCYGALSPPTPFVHFHRERCDLAVADCGRAYAISHRSCNTHATGLARLRMDGGVWQTLHDLRHDNRLRQCRKRQFCAKHHRTAHGVGARGALCCDVCWMPARRGYRLADRSPAHEHIATKGAVVLCWCVSARVGIQVDRRLRTYSGVHI